MCVVIRIDIGQHINSQWTAAVWWRGVHTLVLHRGGSETASSISVLDQPKIKDTKKRDLEKKKKKRWKEKEKRRRKLHWRTRVLRLVFWRVKLSSLASRRVLALEHDVVFKRAPVRMLAGIAVSVGLFIPVQLVKGGKQFCFLRRESSSVGHNPRGSCEFAHDAVTFNHPGCQVNVTFVIRRDCATRTIIQTRCN